MEHETLLSLTAGIVSAHVSHNDVSARDLPAAIQLIFGALVGLGRAQRSAEKERSPAVPVRSSVTAEHLFCLECGAPLKLLKQHIAGHGLTPDEYRLRWSLPAEYPMVTSQYAERRRQIALYLDLGRKYGRKSGR